MTNQSFAGKRSLKTLLSIVIVLILLISIFATTTFASASSTKNVTIIDGTQVIAITTTETEPIKILKSAGFEIEANDKLDITSFGEDGGEIVISRLNTINIESNGKINAYQVYSPTVGGALKEAGVNVDKEDALNYNLTNSVTDGMVITIQKALHVSLVDGQATTNYSIISGTVQDLIRLSGTKLGEYDYTEPAMDKKLKDNMTITVCRVELKNETKDEKVKYSTKKIKDSSMEQGKTKTIKEGKNGKASVTYEVKYVNGKETQRKEIAKTIITQPEAAQVKVGTKKTKTSVDTTPNGVESKNGISVGDTISGKYTHYCACATCNGNSRGITTSGKRIRNGMQNPYYVACNWLPLGSVIEVKGQNYTVVDRGGSGLSRRGRIDIFTPGGHAKCYKLGTGKCSIKIVRLGW